MSNRRKSDINNKNKRGFSNKSIISNIQNINESKVSTTRTKGIEKEEIIVKT